MASIYLSHIANQLPSEPPNDGLIYPLLRKVDDTHLTWAFAAPQPTETDSLKKRRKNRLICAVLRALGFVLDEKNATSGLKFDFFHLADDRLIDPFSSTVFDAATLPDLSGDPANLEIRNPRGAEQKLKLATAATEDIKADALVNVHRFVFANNGGIPPGRFDLGLSGQPTSPGFTANITLEPDLKSEFPSGTLPVLTFDQSGVAGALRCNTVEVIASNKMPGSATTIAADVRHDRLSLDVATLVCTEPDTNPKLAIEVFPAISFQPDADLPVTVSISNDGVCMRLQPRVDSGDKLDPLFTTNRFKPCVRVTIRGPVIHADASATGALEALRLLEPAERRIGETVEQINDYLVYSFEVCLPESSIPEQTLPEIFRFEKLGFRVPHWPRMDDCDFSTYLKQLIGGLPLPRLNVASRRIDFSLEEFQLPGLELNDILSLPDNIQGWKLALRRLDAPDLELPIDSVELSGFTLTVNFSANVDPNIEVALQLPRFSLPSVAFPDVGLPALTEYDFRQFAIVDGKLKVTLPSGLEGMLPDQLPHLWTVRVKRPGGLEFDLKLTAVNVTGLEVEFTIKGELAGLNLRVGLDLLRIKWSIPFAKPSLSVNELTLDFPIPRLRLPEVQGPDGLVIDYRLLTIRARLNGVDLATYTINKILDLGTFKKLELNVPNVNGHYPDLEPLTLENVTLEFGLDLSLPLTKCFLSDLLGDLGSVDFRLSVPRLSLPQFDFAALRVAFGSLATPMIPMELVVLVPHPTKPKLLWDELKLVLGMRFDLSKFRLLDNRIYFFLPQRRSFGESNLAPRQVMDFDIFTLTFPNRPEPLGFPTVDNHDGYLDLTSREFVIDLKYPEPLTPTPAPRIHAFFPGGMEREAARLGREGVENLGKEHVNYGKYRKEYAKRFDLELDEVDPKLWPNTGPDRLMFRFNSNGLTFAANLGKTEVEIDSSGFSDDGASDGSSAGLIKPFKCQPQDKQRELRSRVVIIDNALKEAGVYAKTEVPGVENLMAEVSVVLRQRQKGTLPEVLASMELERADEAPLAEFSIKLLELSLDRLELGLIWRMQEKDWDYSIIADGTIGFTGAAALVPDLEGLRVPSIQVVGLDLRRMNLRQLRVPINLVKPVRFDILDGMFGVELGDLEIGWEFDGKIPKPRLLACELAKLTFKNPGALEVSVSVGGLHIEFDDNLKAHVKLPSSLGIEVALGSSARFAGRVGWVETDVERYLFASGKVMLEGLPEVRGLLKFGTGKKFSGRHEINLVLYGEMDLDEQLFSGAVVKSLGLGVGLNNRLAAIPPTPSADAILRRIDLVKPGELEGWQFVREGGFYMSVIGSVTLASNLGEPDVLNAYVAALVVSIDTNFDLVAAGKLWLSCSVKGQKDNPNNPAFVGAMVLSPRQRKLEVVLESRKNAYVEQNDLIKKLLDKGFVRFAFRMTPQLVDFHLAEVSYRDQMFGVDMEFRGEYRFAIFKRAVLLKNELSATGSISKSLSGGAGGFDLDGQAYLRLGYGGLLSDRGAMAYAFIEAGIRFRVSAWIEIGFSISFKICGKRYSKSWSIVFRTRVPELELTLRGHIAIADRGGFGGFELLVGINVPICGYRLNVKAGWAMNAELYQEVRSTVAAFEAELEAAVAALDQSEPAQINTENGRRILDLHSAAGNSFNQDELISIGVDVPKADEAKTAIDPPSESWLLYSREIGAEAVALLLPAADARWLTPTMATITSITVAGNVATFRIDQLISGLPTETTVRLVGLRAKDPQSAEHVAKINGSWTANIDIENGVVSLDVTDIDDGEHQLLAGVWYIEETITGLSSQDHDTVPYLNEVERAVLRTGDWQDASLSGSNLTTLNPHNFPVTGQRILLRPTGGVVIDPGMERTYRDTDRPSATVLAVPINGEARKLDLIEFSSELEPSDWQFATAIEIAPPWSARNRLAALRDHIRDDAQGFNQDAYRECTGAAAAWAETAGRARDSEAVSADKAYAVVFDERYTSADPRFSPDDAPVAPGVLSTRFRPVDDVEAVGVDAVLAAARRYEEASVGVARQQLHEAFDLDTDEAIQQARAQATQLLVHRLSDPRGLKPGDRLEAPVVDHQADKVAYGWFCKTTTTILNQINPADQDRLFIRRAGGTAEPVSLAIPKTSGVDGLVPELLPIRQDFVIDESSEVRERGRVIVQLPIRYPEEVLRRRPQDIGRLQIYRRIADGPEDLVFDQLRPDISRLDRKQVFSKSRQQFVDDPAELNPDKRQDFRLTANRVTNSSIRFDEQQSRLLLPDRKSAADKLHNFSCRIADQDRIITNAEHIDGVVTLEFEPAIGDGEEQISLELIAEGLIVPRPVLISDEFAVTDRQFDAAELRAALGSGRAPMLRYSLRLLAEDDPGGLKSDRREPWSTPVPLFIPRRPAPLPNLALAIPVGSLLQSSAQGITFQLIDLSEESPKLAERNGRPISADEFEYWLDGDILRQSGFYAGEAADPTSPREGDGERVTLAAVNATNGLESTAGKVRVEVERVPSTTHFKLKDTTLAPGAAFRALFRFKGDTSVRSLRRLPILLVREFPKMWDSTVRYRVIDTAEIIPKADELSVAKGEAKPLLVDFSADDRYEAGRAAIRSAWPSLSLLDGGVELQFRDFDDSSMRSRTLVEVLEADEFSQSQNDFRDDTFWTSRPSDRVDRYISRVVAMAPPRNEAEFKELLEEVYLWKRSNERTRQEEEIDAIRRLVEALKALSAASNWNDYAKAVQMVQTALLSFEKSPLNSNRVATQQLIELLRLTLRAVVVGNKVGATTADKVEDARTTNQSLLELLTRIEQSRAETVSNTDANDVAFLDRDTARKLAGIARRRIAIADEALALQRIEAIPQTASMRKTDSPEALARLDNWDNLLADARSLAADKPLPMTESIVSRFLPQPADPNLPRNHEAAELCKALINGLVAKIRELELEKLVPRAAGLSELLHKLNEKIRDGQSNTPAGLLKRPHHELTTTRKEDGEIVAREVPLRALLPARARQAKIGEIPQEPEERLERLGIRAGHVACLFEHGNVAIWTTRGNSVHDKDNPMERVQYFATGASNITDSDVHAFELSEVAEGPRLLIAATFSSTADVQLWDAGEAKVLRWYGNGTGATFAHTPRGLEVAVVMGGTVFLETTEVPDPTKQVTFSLTEEVLDRLSNHYGVPEPIKNILGQLKDQEFETESAFRGRLSELENQQGLRPHLQVVINQAQNPTLARPPLALTDGGDQGVFFSGPVSYHDEIHVVAAARENEILFWRDLGRPENKTPFYRWTLTFNVHFVSWEDWGSLEENDPGSFFAALDTSGRLHIRRFDAIGTLVDTLEATEDGKDYLVSLDADGEVLSKLEISGLPDGRSESITEFKEKIKQSSASRAIKGDERSVLHSLASLITDLVPPTVTHIQPVTLPAGAGFVIATRDYPKALFFLSPVQRRPEPVDIRESAAVVTQLAVDRRELTASAIIDGKVHVYDLLKLAEVSADLNATQVAVLHGRDDGQDESYLALPYAGTVKIHHLDKADPLQTLPKPEGLEADETGNIVAITSALQTARTATAAGDPLSVFHLWERMGFAVDIAAQDRTTRLLTLKELRNKIDAAIDIVANYKAGHSIYVVEGEEPDAEFRDDRVGFSHVNLAVVPNEFLAACLQPNFDALKKWLKNRSIKLAQEVLPTDSLEEKARKEQENQRELEYIVHMTQLVGVPEPSRYGTVVGNTDPPPALPRGGELRLQPRSDRFVRVPASAGFSHWSWTLPDRKGHRMLVAARRVSRYEPLLRWSLNLHTRFDLAEEVPLKRVGSSETVHTVASPVSKVAVTLNSELEPSTGWQPLRIELVEGPGTGQRREILSIDAATLKLDEGDPLLVELVANQSKCRVMDAAPGWRLVVIDAIHDPARGEGAKPLMVYQYPHSRKPRFSYQVPLDGMRATYNQISRVRTGYDGIEAAFRYFLPDRIDNPEAATLTGLLSEIETSEDTPVVPLPRTVTNVAGGAEPDVRLFRHERMVSLPGLPFFYRYRLDVRSAYQSRLLEWDRTSAAERLPDDENASPPAQRLPASLGLNEMTLRPLVLTGNLPTDQSTESTMVRLFTDGEFEGDLRLRVRPTSGDDWIERSVTRWQAGVLSVDPEFADQPAEGWEYELEAANAFEAVLYLSANRDHLTREEARSEPETVKVRVGCDENIVDVDARDLPDFFMDYNLFRNQQEGVGSLPSISDLFSVIGSIRMPWSPNFKVPSTFPADAKKKPFVSVASGVKLVNVSGDGSPTELGQETSIAIERVTINGSPYWRLRFWIANEPGQAILAKEKVYIQAIRDGKLTRAVKCAMPE